MTYGYVNGTWYTVGTSGVAGADCGSPSSVTIGNTIYIPSTGSAGSCETFAYRWSTSPIPDRAIVTDVRIKFNVVVSNNPRSCNWNSLESDPSGQSASILWADINNTAAGTTFLSSDANCSSGVSNGLVSDLGASADSDLRGKLTQDWWGVGGTFSSMVRDGSTRYVQFHTGNSPPIELRVTYELPVCVNETGNCFGTVQDAINNASSYQTVVIVNSSYEFNENVVLNVTGLTLTSNVSTKPTVWASSGTPLTISANDVTVSRLQIKYNGSSSGYVVYAGSRTNITLRDSTIQNSVSSYSGADYCVYLTSVTQSRIESSTISCSNQATYGIYMTGSTSNNISSNSISAARSSGSNRGIHMQSSSTGNRIFNNSISASAAFSSSINYGVYMSSSGSNTIESNSISASGANAISSIYMQSSGSNTVLRNTLSSSCGYYANTNCRGVYVDSSSPSNTFGYNTVSHNGRGGDYSMQIASTSNTFANGSVSLGANTEGWEAALYVSGSSNRILNNTVSIEPWSSSTGRYGIWLSGSSSSVVSENNVTVGYFSGTTPWGSLNQGIRLESSANSNNVSRNYVKAVGLPASSGGSGSNFAIYLSGSSNNLQNNTMVTSSVSNDYGIYLAGGSNNNITDSIIDAAIAYDIYDGTGATNYVINSTFNKSDIYPSSGELYVMYRVLVRPMNTSNENMPSVLLTFNDSSSVGNADNPTGSFSTQSNSSGYAEAVLAQFVSNSTYNLTSGYLYFNDYTIAASKTGFFGNSSTVTVDSFRSLDLLLRALPVLGTLFGKGLDSYELALDSVYGDVYGYVNTVNASSSLSQGWNHVAVTFDSGAINMYVNGRLAGSASTSSTPAANSRSIMVGNSTSTRADEFRFYGRPLSASEIEQRYLFGSALKAILSASGAGSFGRNFNISAVTTDGSFANRHITAADLLAGTTQSVNLPNATGAPSVVAVTSNSCNQRLEATKSQLSGVWC